MVFWAHTGPWCNLFLRARVRIPPAGWGVSSLIVQAVLVKPVVKWLKERRAVALGLTFGAVGFAVYGLAPTGPIFWIGVPANHHDTVGRPHGAGAPAGRAGKSHGPGEPHRSHGLHPDLGRIHPHA